MENVLFAYGTLQHPRIISFVLDRIPESAQARLYGFARFAIQNEDFPGILAKEDSYTDGTAFFGITLAEWEELDYYESDLYDRQTVRLELEDGTNTQAEVYVIPPENQHVLSSNLWELNQYRPNPLP